MAGASATRCRADRRRAQLLARGLLSRWAFGLLDRYRRQIAKEDQARLVAALARRDYHAAESDATQPRSGVRARSEPERLADPLEQLWKLPAQRPAHGPPGGSPL